jgi:hypothetical protein
MSILSRSNCGCHHGDQRPKGCLQSRGNSNSVHHRYSRHLRSCKILVQSPSGTSLPSLILSGCNGGNAYVSPNLPHSSINICYSGQENLEDRLLGTRNVVQGLPQANLDLLRRVSEHLDKCVFPCRYPTFSDIDTSTELLILKSIII